MTSNAAQGDHSLLRFEVFPGGVDREVRKSSGMPLLVTKSVPKARCALVNQRIQGSPPEAHQMEANVAQRISGAYRLITVPSIYKGLMFSLGAHRAMSRYVDEVLQPRSGNKVLDVGCGPASVLAYLPSVDYTGIDLNEKHIAHARQVYGDRGRFIVGNVAHDLKQEERAFDLINVSGLLHHLDDEEAAALFRSLRRLLKDDGRLITLDPVWLSGQRTAVKLINWLDSGMNIRTPEEYRGLLSGLDFDVETRVLHDLLRIPYDHVIMIVRNSCLAGRIDQKMT